MTTFFAVFFSRQAFTEQIISYARTHDDPFGLTGFKQDAEKPRIVTA